MRYQLMRNFTVWSRRRAARTVPMALLVSEVGKRGCSPPQSVAQSQTLAADAERHNFFLRANSHITILLVLPLSTHKMASEKKVAENMLWGGRFTGMHSQWPDWAKAVGH